MIPEPLSRIALISHADWGIGPRKRWATIARLTGAGRYQVSIPELVADPANYIPTLASELPPESACLLGFDFPIGLPLAYARKAGIADFRTALLQFGTGAWMDFYRPANRPEEIRIGRPFYPAAPGQSKQAHLLYALGIASIDHLRRLCERGYSFIDLAGTPHQRRPASPLFWTMGGQQVGKAAILGWEKALAPALRDADLNLSIWPFDGNFSCLSHRPGFIAVETYPAEYYTRLGIRFHRGQSGGGKRSQAGRRANAQALLDWCSARAIDFVPGLSAWIDEGFGRSPGGEDPFDSLVGLLGMISCLLDPTQVHEPHEGPIRAVEGWIFGMAGIVESGERWAA